MGLPEVLALAHVAGEACWDPGISSEPSCGKL